MKIDLAVIGQGAVTPAGVGLDALMRETPTPIPISSLGKPDETWPVLRVDMKAPVWNSWQRMPRLRRVSPITFYLVEAASQALANATAEEKEQTGLIVAFSAGCLAYSRRFFEAIITQGQRAASPALFPETVFNSPVSHVATVLGLNGAAYALVGDEVAWIAALKTASVWLRQGRVKQVLVLGAEEFDPIVLDAYRSARWLRRQNAQLGFLTSEGAAGLLVRSANANDPLVITGAHDGYVYRTKQEATEAAHRLMKNCDSKAPCFISAQHNWMHSVEESVTKGRDVETDSPYLGEAFTASAAWNTLRALALRNAPSLLLPIWGLNHQLGSLELESRG